MRSVRISRWWFAVPAVVFGAVFVLVLVMVFGPQIESEVSACFEIDESQELIGWLSESEDFGQSIHAEVFEMIAAAITTKHTQPVSYTHLTLPTIYSV